MMATGQARPLSHSSLAGYPDVMSLPLLVTPKENPDLDGVACAVAYAELLSALGTPALPLVSGRPDAEARYVLDRLGWQAPPLPAETGGLVLVDASDVLGMPALVEPARVIEVIDHRLHQRAAPLFPNARLQIEPVGAAATLVCERFCTAKLRLTHTSAVLLLAAIQSNTQQLHGSVTTARDVEAAALLSAMTEMPPGLLEGQLAARGAEIREDLSGAIRREVKRFEHADGAYLFSQLECADAADLSRDALPVLAAIGPRAMLNLVDPARSSSVLLVPDVAFRAWIAAKTGFDFDEVEVRSRTALLRKQIVARIEGHSP